MIQKQFQYIRLVCETPGIATLILNRPPLNIFHLPMLQEMEEALQLIHSESSYRVLLVRGEGKCFSAGMDVSDHLPDKVELMLRTMRKLLTRLVDLEIPTVSALHGSAMGGGLEIAAMTDLTYAVSGTKLAQPEIKLGVFPPVAVAHYPQFIGYKQTADLVFSGRTFSAEEAVSMGLINGAFSQDEFPKRIDTIVREIAGHSRPVLIATKHALRKTSGSTFFHALELAEKIYLEHLMTASDALEGLKLFWRNDLRNGNTTEERYESSNL